MQLFLKLHDRVQTANTLIRLLLQEQSDLGLQVVYAISLETLVYEILGHLLWLYFSNFTNKMVKHF